MRGLNIVILALCCFLSMVSNSCIKERCAGCGESYDSLSSRLLITFSGNYENGFLKTRSNNKIREGIRAAIFTYSSGDNPLHYPSFPGTPVVTTSDEWGNLCLAKGEYLFVPEGIYDFYAISRNSDSLSGITVSKGFSSPLENSIDYLWSSFKESYIEVNTNIVFNFNHCSSRLIIEFIGSEFVKDAQIVSAAINPPERGGRMLLSSGEISKASCIESEMIDMSLNGLSAGIIILPLAQGVNIPVEINVIAKFDGINPELRKCKGVVPAPENGFEGGKSYLFKAKIYEQELLFHQASVLDWADEPAVNLTIAD